MADKGQCIGINHQVCYNNARKDSFGLCSKCRIAQLHQFSQKQRLEIIDLTAALSAKQSEVDENEKMNYPAAIVELRKIIALGDKKAEQLQAELDRLTDANERIQCRFIDSEQAVGAGLIENKRLKTLVDDEDCKVFDAALDKAEQLQVRMDAAEAYIDKSPCDPDITPEQYLAYAKWQKLKGGK